MLVVEVVGTYQVHGEPKELYRRRFYALYYCLVRRSCAPRPDLVVAGLNGTVCHSNIGDNTR